MSDGATIEAGRTAWDKIHGATTFENWRKVALAVSIGRHHALREAGQNKPFGPKYSRALNQWLDANHFREMAEEIRGVLCKVADNVDAIDSWRATLSAETRARQNNPFVVLKNWRIATRPKQPQRTNAKSSGRHRTTSSPPGDIIRRVAVAIREANTRDYFIMATAALNALEPTDLLLLLPDPPKPSAKAISSAPAFELHPA